MANNQHLAILKRGRATWNHWREENPDVLPDFRDACLMHMDLKGFNLQKADFSTEAEPQSMMVVKGHSGAKLFKDYRPGADLRGANLSEANLCKANLIGSDLRGANLSRTKLNNANLSRADLRMANLRGADLRGATLREADLFEVNLSSDLSFGLSRGVGTMKRNLTNLSGSDLRGANLRNSIIVEANFESANLTGCSVYGISAWGLNLKDAEQKDLIITRPDEPTVTVDNIEVAQFIYLLLNNDKIRHVIDTITSKVVLILGRFLPERKAVLDAIREELRNRNYVPVLFDFERPPSQDFTETITLLARMARFIIADLTEPSSVPQELQAIVPDVAVPVQPLLEGDRTYSMFKDYRKYPWMLKLHRYDGLEGLMASLQEKVIAPAEAKAKELVKMKSEATR